VEHHGEGLCGEERHDGLEELHDVQHELELHDEQHGVVLLLHDGQHGVVLHGALHDGVLLHGELLHGVVLLHGGQHDEERHDEGQAEDFHIHPALVWDSKGCGLGPRSDCREMGPYYSQPCSNIHRQIDIGQTMFRLDRGSQLHVVHLFRHCILCKPDILTLDQHTSLVYMEHQHS